MRNKVKHDATLFRISQNRYLAKQAPASGDKARGGGIFFFWNFSGMYAGGTLPPMQAGRGCEGAGRVHDMPIPPRHSKNIFVYETGIRLRSGSSTKIRLRKVEHDEKYFD